MRTRLTKDEKNLLETRQNWIVLLKPILFTIIGSVIALLITGRTTGIIGGIAELLVIGYLIYKIYARKVNLWAVTTLRVIDENGVFNRYSKESPLDKINNVEYEQSLFGRLFGYGEVRIQTAGALGVTTYSLIDNPKLLRDTITQAQELYKDTQIKLQAVNLASALTANNSKTDIALEIEKLHELKVKGILSDEEFGQRKSKLLNS